MTGPRLSTGVLGGVWRAGITTWGAVVPTAGPALDWHVAADDRWHTPSAEAAVRQRRLEGTPVVETRLRIPGGDVVQRIASVPTSGGLTLIEVFNDSPLPVAVAFTRRDLLSARPPADASIEGIDLPADAVAFPVGHHAGITVALAHDGRGAGALPADLPTIDQVVRGWVRISERAGSVVLPDAALAEQMVSVRAELLLSGPGSPDDPASFVLGVDQLVRLGERPDDWLADVAGAAGAVARRAAGRGRTRRQRSSSSVVTWDVGATLDGAARIARVAGDAVASTDLAAVRSRLGLPTAPPLTGMWSAAATDGVEEAMFESSVLGLVAIERAMADGHGRLLAAGIPPAWLGGTIEARGLPLQLGCIVAFALRWHGARPAVLWELEHDDEPEHEPFVITAPVLAPGWNATQAAGEALWPVPPNAEPGLDLDPGPPPPPAPAPQAPTISIATPADGDVSFG